MSVFRAPAHTGPFALGTFTSGQSDDAARPFAGLVVHDWVRELRELRGLSGWGPAGPTVLDLLQDWDTSLGHLRELASGRDGVWHPLADLRVLAPLSARAGAAERRQLPPARRRPGRRRAVERARRTPAEARADAERMMDERIARGRPVRLPRLDPRDLRPVRRRGVARTRRAARLGTRARRRHRQDGQPRPEGRRAPST